MQISLSSVNTIPISYGYVVVYKKALSSIPPLDPAFCKGLFNKPDTTEFGFNQAGLTITENQIVPHSLNDGQMLISLPPNLSIGYQKFSILNNDLDSLLSVYQKLLAELKSKNPVFFSTLTSFQVGINIEFEIIFTKSLINANDWFKSKFFPNFSNINFQDLKFQMIEEEKGKFVGVSLQPRVGKSNALYCGLNDHYAISPSENIFDVNQLGNYIKKTVTKMNDVILNKILN